MPELPEILILSQQMDREFKGQTIKDIQVIQEKCINLPVGDFSELFLGKRIEHVTFKGKWIFIEIEQDIWLLLNLGMGGNVLLHGKDKTLPDKYQLKMDFHDERVLPVLIFSMIVPHTGHGLSSL